MNRAQAARRFAKLNALADPRRGGTPAECEVAAAKARALLARFPDLQREPEAKPKRPRRRRWTATPTGEVGNWGFDWNTGDHTANVKVVHHHNARNWKIEIDPNQLFRS